MLCSRAEWQAKDIQNFVVWKIVEVKGRQHRQAVFWKWQAVMWTSRNFVCSALPSSLQVSRQSPDNKWLDQTTFCSQLIRNYSQMQNDSSVSRASGDWKSPLLPQRRNANQAARRRWQTGWERCPVGLSWQWNSSENPDRPHISHGWATGRGCSFWLPQPSGPLARFLPMFQRIFSIPYNGSALIPKISKVKLRLRFGKFKTFVPLWQTNSETGLSTWR